jgi:hypothetical protein
MVCAGLKKVPVQPLHETVRERVELEYRKLHEKLYQYDDPEVKIDKLSRAAPSKFAGTSSALSPVATVRDVHVGNCPIRIYEPDRDLSSFICGVIVYLHGGKDCSFACVESCATTDLIDTRTGGWVDGDETSEEHIPTKLCHR